MASSRSCELPHPPTGGVGRGAKLSGSGGPGGRVHAGSGCSWGRTALLPRGCLPGKEEEEEGEGEGREGDRVSPARKGRE